MKNTNCLEPLNPPNPLNPLKLSFAPMEGVTGYIFRSAHHKYYGGVDRYLTPFLVPNQNQKFSSRERSDLAPTHNQNVCVIPQLLTNQAADFIWAANRLEEMGYQEVNLNLGCPSATVVSKGKGAGFLARREALEQFLKEIYSEAEIAVSIKTRIGKDSPEEFGELLKLFNQFPIKELIIHPRTQQDFYKNSPRLECFLEAVRESKIPLCYNGDIFSVPAFEQTSARFPGVDSFMLGRGAVANPALPGWILGRKEGKEEARKRFLRFHGEIYDGYREILSGDRDVLFKMKELWSYWLSLFESPGRAVKKIKKAVRCSDYDAAVWALLSESEFNENGAFGSSGNQNKM